MRTFTAVVPTQSPMPLDLGLLLAPVRLAEPSAPEEYAGRTDGIVLDEEGRAVAFIVRLARRFDARASRTLVPVTAMTLTEGPTLHLSWSEDQLLAQPRLDSHLDPHNRVDGGPPVESQWMPARPNIVPPGGGPNATEVATETIGSGVLGATLGALAGLAIGGPIAAASMALFFAAGGSLAGFLSGASQETAAEASEMKLDSLPTESYGPLGAALRSLEARLRDPGLWHVGLLTATPFTPATTTVERAA